MGLFSRDSNDSDDEDDRSLLEKASDAAREGVSGLTDFHEVKIDDYDSMQWELKEANAMMRVNTDGLKFKQNRFVGDDATFSIGIDEIDFEHAEIWTREDHETENLNRLLHGDDFPLGGERIFVKLPVSNGGYFTISIGGESIVESNPNEILRELRDVSGVHLEKRESRSAPAPSHEQDDGQDPLEQLERLKELRDEGAITEDEFEDKKQDLLDRI